MVARWTLDCMGGYWERVGRARVLLVRPSADCPAYAVCDFPLRRCRWNNCNDSIPCDPHEVCDSFQAVCVPLPAGVCADPTEVACVGALEYGAAGSRVVSAGQWAGLCDLTRAPLVSKVAGGHYVR